MWIQMLVSSRKCGSIRGLCAFVVTSHAVQTLHTYNVPSTSGEHTMHYRKFGRIGWNVSEIGYGMWGLAGWTGSDDAESLDALPRAVDLGCNFFDPPMGYRQRPREQNLGKSPPANS